MLDTKSLIGIGGTIIVVIVAILIVNAFKNRLPAQLRG